jgi:SAM-dependent methyltransferase
MYEPSDRDAPAPGLLRRAGNRVPFLRRLAMSRLGPLEEGQAELRAEQARLGAALETASQDLADVTGRLAELVHTVDEQRINHELLKGELWETRVQITDFSRQLTADARLVTAGGRIADLKDAIGALERRMRKLDRPAPPAGALPPAADGAPATGATAGVEDISSALFDYVGFERRFRGDPEVINGVLHDRYAEVLRAHQPVVDIGCGRGELLELLARDGIEVIGVEPDPGMAAEARARGITVHEALASEYLAGVPDGSLGAVISTHVVEHLPLDALVDFLERSAQKLRPGGVFIAETPNPATLIVLGSHFIMDPTHVWPLHPDLLSFLAESAGFREVRAEFFSPADTLHLPLGDGSDAADPALSRRVDEGFTRLNQVLFGPQDYAVFATVGTGGTVDAEPADAGPAAAEPADAGPAAAEPADAGPADAQPAAAGPAGAAADGGVVS